MRSVKRKDTLPEMRVRRCLHRLGVRYRLHRKDLPGSPDIVSPRRRLCIFVHGCFWHRHQHCPRATFPKSNTAYWEKKFADNIERDRRDAERLRDMGWRVETVWECQTVDDRELEGVLREIFGLTGETHLP